MGIILNVGDQTVNLSVQSGGLSVGTYIPGPQGVPGPPGPASGEGYLLPTDSDIGGNRAIATVNGYANYADCTDPTKQAIGLSMGAVSSGADVTIKSGGKMVITGAGWLTGAPIYLSVNGTLTQTEPTTGFSQVLGMAHSSDTILINIQKQIILS